MSFGSPQKIPKLQKAIWGRRSFFLVTDWLIGSGRCFFPTQKKQFGSNSKPSGDPIIGSTFGEKNGWFLRPWNWEQERTNKKPTFWLKETTYFNILFFLPTLICLRCKLFVSEKHAIFRGPVPKILARNKDKMSKMTRSSGQPTKQPSNCNEFVAFQQTQPPWVCSLTTGYFLCGLATKTNPQKPALHSKAEVHGNV